jgi:hypothetical protein
LSQAISSPSVGGSVFRPTMMYGLPDSRATGSKSFT